MSEPVVAIDVVRRQARDAAAAARRRERVDNPYPVDSAAHKLWATEFCQVIVDEEVAARRAREEASA